MALRHRAHVGRFKPRSGGTDIQTLMLLALFLCALCVLCGPGLYACPVVPWSRGPVVPWSRGPVVPWSRASRYALRSTRAQPMPELPEVETTRAGLAPHLLGRRISAVRLRRPDLRWQIPVNLPMLLNGD